MHWLALEAAVGPNALKHQSPSIFCDNINAVSWCYKYRSNTSIIATRILTVLATRLHHCNAGLLAIDHISGSYNTMADIASRKHTKDLTKILCSYSKRFPPPQNNSWNLFQHSTKITCKICSQLLHSKSRMESWSRLSEKGRNFFTLGPAGLARITQPYHQPCTTSPEPNNSPYWWPTHKMLGAEAFLLENTKFVPKRSRWHSEPSQRRVNWTENTTRWKDRKANIRRRLVCFSKSTTETTHHQKRN